MVFVFTSCELVTVAPFNNRQNDDQKGGYDDGHHRVRASV